MNRLTYILSIRKSAVENGTCKEEYYGELDSGKDGCEYPHCHCLYGEDGPIDPETGETIKNPTLGE